ncbi:PHO85 cyclin-9 [Purpureocillium lavendulum]|uniref:PHO85 cyclin-9 n=1 Tax=Purpureocillium lavendulum TaxID=1247861 RepID=A0AB34FF48_9HYPO|nr:PHO85 cyclin-9 [Purpureocillium lavendulum]
MESVESNSKPNSSLVLDEHSKAKRRASLPDITADLKRPRLDELVSPAAATSQGGRPQHDPIRDEDYRKQVLAELKLGRSKPNSLKRGKPELSHGEVTNQLVYEILRRSRPPATDESDNPEAHFWTGDQAAVGVDLGSVHIPLITKDQQRFRWRDGRPVVQLFRRMEDLDRRVAVQIPSLSSEKDSFQSRCLRDVEKRFLDGQPTDDPWNLLDLGSPLPPSVLPSFLEGENCQLLPRVRDAVLMGSRAERAVAPPEDWNLWRDVLEWVLLSQGGHMTAPHMDSHGFSTWITVQEGRVGFGWLSRPTVQERLEWTSNPDSYPGGNWRYVILPPGWTVFFPSGTIHFVFRIRSEQTLGLGGHILQWTSIRSWLEVVADQMRNPKITNEDMGPSAKKYINIVLELIAKKIKNDY